MNNYYSVIKLSSERRESRDFVLDRPHGTDDFLFLHFKTPIKILQGGEVITAPKGSCLVTTPGEPHWFKPDDCELVHDWIHFLPDDAENFLRFEFPVNSIFYPLNTSFITPIVRDCQQEFINKELYWQTNVSARLSMLFVLLAREAVQGGIYFSKYMRELFEEFKTFRFKMYENAAESHSIDEMAKELSLSRSRFSVLYKTFFGVSPKEDLIEARITYAKFLLSIGNPKIETVAQNAGYNNVYHFIRQFKKSTGVTPGNFNKT